MFRRRRSTDDFAEEIKSHLELEADELRSEGFSQEEANRKARVEFGNVQSAQERFYLRSRVAWFDNLLRDVQFATRQLARKPGFACVAFLVLALGKGTSVAIFAFVDAALLEPLPSAIVGCVAHSPVTDLSLSGGSWSTRSLADPYFTQPQASELVRSYLAGHDASDPFASPLHANPAGLPPIRVHVGDDDHNLFRTASEDKPESVSSWRLWPAAIQR